MNARTPSSELVAHAYRLLKQDTYYDKMDLFLRANLADYEADGSFQQRQDRLATVIDDLRKAESSPRTQRILKKWIADITFRLLPKSVELPDSHPEEDADRKSRARLISNVRTANEYIVAPQGGVQYFIYAPIELYILSTLWCMTVGPVLDCTLDNGCFGNRLESDEGVDEDGPSRLFKIFHFQYTKWRDTAIQRAEELLDQGRSSVLVSLDIKQCYYHLAVDWEEVPISRIRGLRGLAKNLTAVLRSVHSAYHDVIGLSLAKTHGDKVAECEGIPIGLPSSRVLANWLLEPFDTAVREELRPAYYGRYVDDMLIVVQAPPDSVIRAGVDAILNDLLVKRGLLRPSEDATEYVLCCLPGLVIQNGKLIVQHFDKDHSRAGLREFIKQIKREASDFRFLPADERGRELDACAYDIIYEGSINKLRSVIGITENSTELSKYLARRMVEHRLTSEALHKNTAEQLDRFTRGKNILDFCTTWERILTLLIVKKQHVKAADMLRRCLETVEKLCASNGSDSEWIKQARENLKDYLCIALAMPLALLAQDGKGQLRSKRLLGLIHAHFVTAHERASHFRRSNLVRHHWVSWPLVNYTQYKGPLVGLDMDMLAAMEDWSIDLAESMTPRHIHADERQLFNLFRLMLHPEGPGEVFFFKDHDSLESGDDAAESLIVNVSIPSDPVEKMAIGIANLHVSERDISASYDPLRVPNTTWERQADLFHLLNLAELESCDVLVLPEVSVPHSWLPFMVAHARQAETALVFGMEHWISGKTAYNFLVTILPYREGGMYRACRIFIRPKNHYSPGELRELDRLDLRAPDLRPGYFLFNWRGVRFTVFNCYELSNIRHRSAFRSKIDLLIGAEWNQDTKYFSNIVESTVRDLHCYMVQVNTSHFGDSRVTSPKKSEKMNLVQVSGGANTTLLKAEIDIHDLNDFRSKKPSPVDTRYKPTPAGFEHDAVRER